MQVFFEHILFLSYLVEVFTSWIVFDPYLTATLSCRFSLSSPALCTALPLRYHLCSHSKKITQGQTAYLKIINWLQRTEINNRSKHMCKIVDRRKFQWWKSVNAKWSLLETPARHARKRSSEVVWVYVSIQGEWHALSSKKL